MVDSVQNCTYNIKNWLKLIFTRIICASLDWLEVNEWLQ